MTIESHVCSLDLARKLRDLGVKQESYFYWFEWATTSIVKDKYYSSQISGEKPYSAYLSSELGELMPDNIEHPDEADQTIHLEINHSVLWSVTYTWQHFKTFSDNSLCNAMAKMLIHLIEQGIVKI